MSVEEARQEAFVKTSTVKEENGGRKGRKQCKAGDSGSGVKQASSWRPSFLPTKIILTDNGAEESQMELFREFVKRLPARSCRSAWLLERLLVARVLLAPTESGQASLHQDNIGDDCQWDEAR